MKISIPTSRVADVKDINKISKVKPVTVLLNSGKVVHGMLAQENEKTVVLTHVLSPKMDTLTLDKSQIEKILPRSKPVYVDLGFLRAGSLVGLELEFPLGSKSSFFFGAGFQGYGGGLNFFFKNGHNGPGFKLAYNNQGFGNNYAGSLGSLTLFYKMSKGISGDLGLARVLRRGNYNYENYNVILWYGVGLRI